LELYAERQVVSRAAYQKMLSFQPSQGLTGLKKAAMAVQTYELLQPKVRMTSYLVLRLFARLGTPSAALPVLDQGLDGTIAGSMQGEVHEDVLDVLEALDDDPGDPVHWLSLSRMFKSYNDLDLALWASRRGWRLDPWGHIFPLEIGRLYDAQGDREGALEYMDLALSLEAERPLIYQELMTLHVKIVSRSLSSDDPAAALPSLDRLEELLADFTARWPGRAVGLSAADVDRMRGFVAFRMGEPERALAHLESSLEASRDIRTIHHLAMLYARSMRFDEVHEVIREAEKVHFEKHGEAYYWKTVLGMLDGDVLALESRPQDAARVYGEALKTAMEGLPFVEPGIKAEMEARLGLLMMRLGRPDTALDHLKRSVASGADTDCYELMLSSLTSSGRIDAAETMLHYALTDSAVEPERRLLFSVWEAAASARAGEPVYPKALDLLEEAAGEDWPEALYGLAAGTVDAAAAAAAAGDDPRAHAALSYVNGCLHLGRGEKEQAIADLRAVIDAHQVADPHHAMAIEVLGALGALPAP
jgi:tetratricopeptide (TPR) repeat protein